MSRKYRQQGYQDSGARDRDRDHGSGASAPRPDYRSLTSEERIQRRSLRRATDREASEVLRCHECGRAIHAFGTIRSDSVCPHCTAHLHCCRTCVHFDTGARWQCRAEIPAAVSAKSEPNTCAQHQPRLVLDSTGRRSTTKGPSGAPRANDPKAQFENLFKR